MDKDKVTAMHIFLSKWSSFWILNKDAKKLDAAFEREVNELLKAQLEEVRENIYNKAYEKSGWKPGCKFSIDSDDYNAVFDEHIKNLK